MNGTWLTFSYSLFIVFFSFFQCFHGSVSHTSYQTWTIEFKKYCKKEERWGLSMVFYISFVHPRFLIFSELWSWVHKMYLFLALRTSSFTCYCALTGILAVFAGQGRSVKKSSRPSFLRTQNNRNKRYVHFILWLWICVDSYLTLWQRIHRETMTQREYD